MNKHLQIRIGPLGRSTASRIQDKVVKWSRTMIVSAIEGRIRYVEPELKKPVKADAVEKNLRKVEGLTDAKVNRQTGSLLVFYDHTVAPSQAIRKQIDSQLRTINPSKTLSYITAPRARRKVKMGMLGTLTGSISLLLFDSEKWHFRFGTAFLLLLMLHLFQNRKRLFK